MNKIKKVKNVSPEQCREAILALRDSIDIWGGKWKLMILLYLTIKKDEKNGFLQMVRDLEANKLVTRSVQNTKPITVNYSITKYGKLFIPVAQQLVQWGLSHRKLIKTAFAGK